MQWSPQQDSALVRANRWLRDESAPQVFRLFGYAGTGKTELAKRIAQDVEGSVYFAAPTNKAASVMRSRGCRGAGTVHSLIYRYGGVTEADVSALEERYERLRREANKVPGTDKAQRLRERAREVMRLIESLRASGGRPMFMYNERNLLVGASLLILDEGSMIDRQTGEDLLQPGCKILVLGDPAQLPPVRGQGFFTEGTPDVMLTEIHRQARDNPIINLAADIRQGYDPVPGDYGKLRIVPRGHKLDPQYVMGHDQILCWRNETRRACNARVRHLLGHAGHALPRAGEKVLAMRNNPEAGVMNGAFYRTMNDAVPGESSSGRGVCLLDLKQEDDEERVLSVDAAAGPFLGIPYDFRLDEGNELEYGYAATVHKAQGSQWHSVLVYDECTDGSIRRRWLYTAVTRAQERLTVAGI